MKEYKDRDCLGPLGENLKQGAERPQKTGIFSTGGPDTQSASDYKLSHRTRTNPTRRFKHETLL